MRGSGDRGALFWYILIMEATNSHESTQEIPQTHLEKNEPEPKTREAEVARIDDAISQTRTNMTETVRKIEVLRSELGLSGEVDIPSVQTSQQKLDLLNKEKSELEAGGESNSERKGIDFVFEQNPELSKFGSKEQYLNYIEQIFPQSNFKEVVYHGSPVNTIEKFNEKRKEDHVGIYFSRSLEGATNYARSWEGTEKVYPVVLNITNPQTLNGKEYSAEEYNKIQMIKEKPIGIDAIFYDNDGGINDEVAVFNSDQVHILGNEQDLDLFKDWIEKNDPKNTDSEKIQRS